MTPPTDVSVQEPVSETPPIPGSAPAPASVQAAPKAAKPVAPKAPKAAAGPKGGKIKVKLKDGRVGTSDPKDFNSATMTRLPQ